MSDFEQRLPIDQIRDGDRVDLIADANDCAAIAERLDLLSLDRLEAHAVLSREGQQVRAQGRLKASLAQACVATGEPVPEHVDEAFNLTFVPAPGGTGPEEEVELENGDLDTIFHDGAGIELGREIADTLALSIDPYPRSAEADVALREAGVMSEEEAGPFAALAALKSKMDRGTAT
ncbi:MAG: YceD family protein [Sphingomicrobium sp.]